MNCLRELREHMVYVPQRFVCSSTDAFVRVTTCAKQYAMSNPPSGSCVHSALPSCHYEEFGSTMQHRVANPHA